MASTRSPITLILALSVTQIIGWATMFSSPAILARHVASDLGTSLPFALAGSSFFLVAFAFASRLLAHQYRRVGSGPILVMGSIAASIALVLLGLAQNAWQYAACFLALGFAGAGALTTSSNTLLTEYAGKDAKRAIIAVMLGSGLSSSIGFPIIALLAEQFGWRWTVFLFSAANLIVCVPLHLLAARQVAANVAGSLPDEPAAAQTMDHHKRLFRLLAIAVSAIGFVTWGFAVVIVELLRAFGLDASNAIALAALVGVVQVGARLAEFIFVPKMQATRSAIAAATLFPLSFMALVLLQGVVGAAFFVILYGVASGGMSIARATLPLELFDAASYGAMTSRLALPMYLAFAAAPFAFGATLDLAGPVAVCALAIAVALLALAALIALRRAANDSPAQIGREA